MKQRDPRPGAIAGVILLGLIPAAAVALLLTAL